MLNTLEMTTIASSDASQFANDADVLQSTIRTVPITLVPQPHSSYNGNDRYDDGRRSDSRFDDDTVSA
jgi:hypothetical protein